jgi:choline dehydrogenase
MGDAVFDYIVVGAGSAGCVVADRLSESGRHSVLVLEAGGSDRRLWVKLPMGYGKTFYDPAVNWKFESQPDAGLKDRRIYFPRGKVLGGSSAINAMVYCRGLPGDFNDWAAMGNPGWGWDDVRPVFERFENPVDANGRPADGAGKALFVSDVREQLHPLESRFFGGAKEAGLSFTDDFNGDEPEGVGRYRINTRHGQRWSAADAFLRPALRRRNVQLHTRAMVSRVEFEGQRASGIAYLHEGHSRRAQARRAVVLCAGAVQTPQLLQVSGVGPGALLQQHGVPVVHDQSQVGQNLQDHLAMSYSFEARQPTLNDQLGSLWGRARMGLQYLFTRSGPLSISVNQCGGFVASMPGLAQADMQLYCNPITYQLLSGAQGSRIVPDPFAGFILCFQPCRPKSRGQIRLASPDMHTPPLIDPCYLSHPEDITVAVRGARLVRRLSETPVLQQAIKRAVGPDLAAMDEAAMAEDFRQRASTCYHPVGSCRMGSDAATSVVSPRLRVHGLQALYVVDASVFPAVTSGNTHAPTTMVAHQGAAFILADTGA